MEKTQILVILGPTATGKSAAAVELAQRYNGEIISGDSALVYQEMNIGTAKPSKEELALVPHHLVDILPPTASFNVSDFQSEAKGIIQDISARGKLPIICGGTGLYLKALLEDYQFNNVAVNPELRRELEGQAALDGGAGLYARLEQLAPETAQNIHPNNVQRVIRALEAVLSGEDISRQRSHELQYDALVIGLNMERAKLYERINYRVDRMLEAGLVDEVRGLLAKGVSPDCQSMQSIGYRQMVWYLQQSITYEEAVDKLKQATRNFAKRQLTWYRHQMPYVHWIEVDPAQKFHKYIAQMACLLEHTSVKYKV